MTSDAKNDTVTDTDTAGDTVNAACSSDVRHLVRCSRRVPCLSQYGHDREHGWRACAASTGVATATADSKSRGLAALRELWLKLKPT